ncbi:MULTISPECIES: FxLD family lanthipeptide [unclassified Streptosporangium]|uniref:FxLD family lanthipeptide n=1 Tax=unclassified Streptosporangium TaxID=2632669 RepID=UPI002E2D8E2C|nr:MULTISPECIES: FxLD family lanthipeptide [unclassified Streptosporangium]
MTICSARGAATLTPPALESQTAEAWDTDAWEDLDVSFVESGVAAEQLIRMTDDGCNATCATACVSCGT